MHVGWIVLENKDLELIGDLKFFIWLLHFNCRITVCDTCEDSVAKTVTRHIECLSWWTKARQNGIMARHTEGFLARHLAPSCPLSGGEHDIYSKRVLRKPNFLQ